jgi:hypothetical protein
MNKLALTLALGTSLVASLASAQAYDSDPGYGARASFDPQTGYSRNNYATQSSTQRANARNQPMYYRPVQRYYGKGYTIAYNYVPVSRRTVPVATDYEPQNLNIPANKIAAYGSKAPRIAVGNLSSQPRLAGRTSIVKQVSPALLVPPTVAAPSVPVEPPPVAAGPEKVQ